MKDQLYQHFKKHELYYAAGFFFLGIIFDVFTLGRPDEAFNLIQQFIYLIILSSLFYFDLKAKHAPDTTLPKNKWWQYHEILAHFLYGSLLSAFTLFFFKSSSFISSFFFLLLMMSLLVINEVPRFQKIGPLARMLLLTLCWFCYFMLLIPIFIGFVGWISFLLALALISLILFYTQKKLTHVLSFEIVKKEVIVPSSFMITLFSFFYLMQIIPPVPLHIEKIGIFHAIEKKNGDYIGKSYSSDCEHWWKSSYTHYHLQPGDQLVLIFSLFAPSSMEDEVKVHWRVYENGKWRSSDQIAVNIKGGRSSGYRGFTVKNSIHPGDWEVRIETTDGRVIGQLGFEIIDSFHGNETFDIF